MLELSSATTANFTREETQTIMANKRRYRQRWCLTGVVTMITVTTVWLGSVIYHGNHHTPMLATLATYYEGNARQEEVKAGVEEKEKQTAVDFEEEEEMKTEDYKEGGNEEEETEDYNDEEEEEKEEGNTNIIEAAMMAEEDRQMEENQIKLQAAGESQNQENHKVERSVKQDMEFSVLLADKNWDKEDPQVKTRFELRKKTMDERCQVADTSKELFSIVRSNKFGIFFKQKASTCLANKSGSTTWRSHLKRVNQAKSIYQQFDKRWKAFMKQPNLQSAVAQTSRIITVRHPLTRLVSAYRQRFGNGKPLPLHIWSKKPKHAKKYFSNYWLPAIISNDVIPKAERPQLGIPKKHTLNKTYSTTLLKRIHDKLGRRFTITFPMFLRHVIYTHKNNLVDSHWRPIDWLCSPCLLRYEYIVKLETMNDDVKYVFDQLHIPSKPEMQKNRERSTENPWSDLKKYETVPLDMKKDIIRLYWNDFYLFDYKLPPGFLDD